MEDFEEAVETGTLPTFLKQDIDLDNGVDPSRSIQEVELEKLMREMTDTDLDKLAGELGGGTSKAGLIVPEATEGEQDVPTSAGSHEKGGSEKSMGSVGSLGTLGSLSPVLGGDLPRSKVEVGELLRNAVTVDGLMAAVEKAEGKEKVD